MGSGAKIISYVPQHSSKSGREYAFDEDGNPVDLKFGWFLNQSEFYANFDADNNVENYVQVNGVMHLCWDIHFDCGMISFWAEPVSGVKSYDEWKAEKAATAKS